MAKKNNTEQTAEGLPLVATDLGSSSFKFVAAEPADADNPECSPLRILAYDVSCKYEGVVRKGVVQNTSNASYMLRESLLLMGNKMQRTDELPTAFALLGGKSMRCVDVQVKRSQGTRLPVSQDLLMQMREECFIKVEKSKAKEPLAGLDARLYSILLDGEQHHEEPLPNVLAKQLDAHYSTFYGSSLLREKTEGSFERAGKSIEAAFARPAALVEALASEEDEIAGLCIIDLGAQTSTISVYKAGRFLTSRVLPYGGQNITDDIATLGISAENAEKLKRRFGNAMHPAGETAKVIKVRAAQEDDKPVLIKTDFLSEVIQARLEEVLAPLLAELKKYEDQIGVVYLTGGGAKMAGITDYVQAHTSLPVDIGSHADWLEENTTPQELYGPEFSAVIGALLLGARYRRRNPGKALPGTKIKSGRRLTDYLVDLFTPSK